MRVAPAIIGLLLLVLASRPAATGQLPGFLVPALPAEGDPFPIRRIVWNAEQRARWQQPAGEPPRVAMPRAEFEDLVRRARRAMLNPPPQIATARYSAALVDSHLVGTGEWMIVHRADRPGLVPLDPLRLALSRLRWDDDTPAGFLPAALVAAGDRARPPSLCIEGRTPPTGARLRFDWSARSTELPGDRLFELAVPMVPVAELSLALPAEWEPLVPPGDALMTGPEPIAGSGMRGWRIAFGGRSRLSLLLRSVNSSRPSPPAQRVNSRLILGATHLEGRIRYDYEPRLLGQREQTFEVDPRWTVVGVASADPVEWSIRPPAATEAPALLTVRSRDGSQGPFFLEIGVEAPLPSPGAWTIPILRDRSGAADQDRISLQWESPWIVTAGEPGGYVLERVQATEQGGRELTYRRGLAPPDRTGSMPRLTLDRAGPSYSIAERTTFDLDRDGTKLTSRLAVTVDRGPVEQFRIRFPRGMVLSQPPAVEQDPAAEWQPEGETGGSIRLSRPLHRGQTVEIHWVARGPANWQTHGIDLPAAQYPGAGERTGAIAITIPPDGEADLDPPLVEPRPAGEAVRYLLPYRDHPPLVRITARLSLTEKSLPVLVTVSHHRNHHVINHVVDLPPAGPSEGFALLTTSTKAEVWKVYARSGDRNITYSPFIEAPETLALLGATGGLVQALGMGRTVHETVWLIPRREAMQVTASLSLGDMQDQPVDWQLPRIRGYSTVLPANRPLPARLSVAADPAKATMRWTPWLHASAAGLSETYRIESAEHWIGRERLRTTIRGRVIAGESTIGIPLPNGIRLESCILAGTRIDRPTVVNGQWQISDAAPGTTFEATVFQDLAGGWQRVTTPFPDAESIRWECDEGISLGLRLSPVQFGSTTVQMVPHSYLFAAGIALGLGLILATFLRGTKATSVRGRCGVSIATISAVLIVLISEGGWSILAGPVAGAGLLVLTLQAGVLGIRGVFAVSCAIAVVAVPANGPAAEDAREPETVYFVAASAEAPDRFIALVAPATIDRLQRLIRGSVDAVDWLSADYVIHEDEGHALVTATWVVRSRTTESKRLELPFPGANLMSLRLDGRVSFPLDRPGGNCAVDIAGAGRQVLQATFQVPIVASGSDRQIRFTVPETVATKVDVTTGPRSRGLTATLRQGRQISSLDGQGAKLTADLGLTRTMDLRWRAGPRAASAPAATMTARESLFWDLRPGSAMFTGRYHIHADASGPSRLRFTIPAELSVVRVTAQPAENLGPVLADWTLGPDVDGRRTLTTAFHGPIDGPLTVELVAVPRQPFSTQTLLHVPRLADLTATTAFAFLRGQGVTLAETSVTGADAVPVPEAIQQFPEESDLRRSANPPQAAYRITSGRMPEWRITMAVPPEPRTVVRELNCTIGRRVEWEYRLTGTGAVEPFSRWRLPAGSTVQSMRGTGVLNWTQAGDLLQLLRETGTEGSLRWSVLGPELSESAFDLILPVELNGAPGPTQVRFRPVPGYELAIPPQRGVQPNGKAPGTVLVDPGVASVRVTWKRVVLPRSVVPKPVPVADATPERTSRERPDPHPSAAPERPMLREHLVVAMLVVVLLIGTVIDRDRFWPETLMGTGLAAAWIFAPVFAVIAGAGVLARLQGLYRILGRHLFRE